MTCDEKRAYNANKQRESKMKKSRQKNAAILKQRRGKRISKNQSQEPDEACGENTVSIKLEINESLVTSTPKESSMSRANLYRKQKEVATLLPSMPCGFAKVVGGIIKTLTPNRQSCDILCNIWYIIVQLH